MEWFEKLVSLRETLGFKQGEFASILKTSQKELSSLESGKKTFLPKWYLNYLLDNDYDLNSLYNKNLILTKISSTSHGVDLFQELDNIERSRILDYLLEQKNVLKVLAQEGDGKGKYSLEDRVRKLEAITAILLMRVKLSKEEFENK